MYIVKQGDFSVNFIFKVQKTQSVYSKNDVKAYKESNLPSTFTNQYGQHEKQMQELKQSNFCYLKLAIMSCGFVFGFEDILLRVPRNYTVKCETMNGMLLVMNQNEFYRKIFSQSKTLQDRFQKQLQINEGFYLNQELKQHDLCKLYTKYIIAEPVDKKIQSLKKQLNTMVQSQKSLTPTIYKTHLNNSLYVSQSDFRRQFQNKTDVSILSQKDGIDDTLTESLNKTRYLTQKAQFYDAKQYTSVQTASQPSSQRTSFYDLPNSPKQNINEGYLTNTQPFSPQSVMGRTKNVSLDSQIYNISYQNSIIFNNSGFTASVNGQQTKNSDITYNEITDPNMYQLDEVLNKITNKKRTNSDQLIKIKQDDNNDSQDQTNKSISRITFADTILKNNRRIKNRNSLSQTISPKQSYHLPKLREEQSNFDQSDILQRTALSTNTGQYKKQNTINMNKTAINLYQQKKTRNNSFLNPTRQTTQNSTTQIHDNQNNSITSPSLNITLTGINSKSNQETNNYRTSHSVDQKQDEKQKIEQRNKSTDSHFIKIFLDPTQINFKLSNFQNISKKEIPLVPQTSQLVKLIGDVQEGDENYETFQKKKQELVNLLFSKDKNENVDIEESYQDQQQKYIFGHYHQLKRKHEQFQYFDSVQIKTNQKCKLNKSQILNDFFNNCQKNQEIYNKIKKRKEQWNFSRYYDVILNPDKYAEKIVKKIQNSKKQNSMNQK